ncbi:MAG: hypothetical protein AVDCRST_MAG12-1593, partial [uncultured Rubrobacteraceae bacterium]
CGGRDGSPERWRSPGWRARATRGRRPTRCTPAGPRTGRRWRPRAGTSRVPVGPARSRSTTAPPADRCGPSSIHRRGTAAPRRSGSPSRRRPTRRSRATTSTAGSCSRRPPTT